MLCVSITNRLIQAILMSTFNIPLLFRKFKSLKYFPKLSPFTSWPAAMINPQLLELAKSRIILQGPKDIWTIEVLLYFRKGVKSDLLFFYKIFPFQLRN